MRSGTRGRRSSRVPTRTERGRTSCTATRCWAPSSISRPGTWCAMSTFEGTDRREGTQPLPAPAARYFEAVLPEGHRPITHARLAQEGTFRLGASERSWRPFKAVQDFGAYPPGFVWDARVRLAPGLSVRIRDR